MEIKGGSLVFKSGEAAAITNVLPDAVTNSMETPLDPAAIVVEPVQARDVVRALHEVITDTRLPESQREEATNQIMQIALTGIRSSEDAHRSHLSYRRAAEETMELHDRPY